MNWKNAILAGGLVAGLSLSFVPKASADFWWRGNGYGNGYYRHNGNDCHRRYDRDWYRRDGWRRYDDDRERDWSRRDRWFDGRRSDGRGTIRGRGYGNSYLYYSDPWADW